MAKENQPIAKVEWRHRDQLHANDYNPNHVAKPEKQLLKTSILEDGWAMPIVIRPDGEIVDGFHRWSLSADPQIYALTDGFVPCVVLPQAENRAHQIASTVRYNRARGVHGVLPMADIVAELLAKSSDSDLVRLLGMDSEEVRRLADRGNMRKRGSQEGFNKGWVPDA